MAVCSPYPAEKRSRGMGHGPKVIEAPYAIEAQMVRIMVVAPIEKTPCYSRQSMPDNSQL
jgi:hypothetical protein